MLNHIVNIPAGDCTHCQGVEALLLGSCAICDKHGIHARLKLPDASVIFTCKPCAGDKESELVKEFGKSSEDIGYQYLTCILCDNQPKIKCETCLLHFCLEHIVDEHFSLQDSICAVGNYPEYDKNRQWLRDYKDRLLVENTEN